MQTKRNKFSGWCRSVASARDATSFIERKKPGLGMLLRLFFPSYFRWWLMKNFWFRINLFLHFLSLPRKVIKQTNQASLRDFFNFQCRQVLTLTTKAKERLWTPSVNGNWSNYLCFLFFLKSSVSWEKLLEENKTFYIPSIFLDLCLFIISPFSFLEFWSVWMIREKFSILLPQFLPLAPLIERFDL